MAINQNAPFARHYVDLPTPVAVKLEEAARAAGKSKKAFIADAITAAVERMAAPNKRK